MAIQINNQMRHRLLALATLILFTIPFTGITSGQQVNYSDPGTWLLGYFDQDALLLEPHDKWYNNEFDKYEFDPDALMELAEMPKENLKIVIVLGTWCPDSRREVPRFLKVLQSCGFPMENVDLIGVDSYKIAPIENYDKLDIERVPTFIIYKNKVEAGRIIEYPKSSLERDMVEILASIKN